MYYGIIVLDVASGYFINPILIQQKICQNHYFCEDFAPSEFLFLKLDPLKLDDDSKLQIASCVYMYINGLAPVVRV